MTSFQRRYYSFKCSIYSLYNFRQPCKRVWGTFKLIYCRVATFSLPHKIGIEPGNMFHIIPFSAPPGALIAIPTYKWSITYPLFRSHRSLITTLCKCILATAASSKALTQPISWPHGNRNGDYLVTLGNYRDNAWAPLGTIWRPLGTTWKLYGQHYDSTTRNNLAIWRKDWKKFETTLRQI